MRPYKKKKPCRSIVLPRCQSMSGSLQCDQPALHETQYRPGGHHWHGNGPFNDEDCGRCEWADTKEDRVTKALKAALLRLHNETTVISTADTFRDLQRLGYATSLGLGTKSKSRGSVSLRPVWKITAAGKRRAEKILSAPGAEAC